MKDIEAITFAAKHGILNLYKKGFSDGNKAANKKIKPMIQEIHDNVYAEGIKKGREKAINEFVEFVKNDWKVKNCAVVFDEPSEVAHIGEHIVRLIEQLAEEVKEQKNE